MTTDKTTAMRRPSTTPKTRRDAKKDQLIRMLSGPAGADIATLSTKLGWRRHTTRAALTGLRKAGYDLRSETPEQGKAAGYRIVAMPASATAAEPGEAANAR